MHTQDFEHFLDLENVVGVEYDEDTGKAIAFVSKKKSKKDIPEDQLVEQNVDEGQDTDVIELGEFEAESTEEKFRPVIGGVSEIHADSSAATAGPYPVKVTDTSKGVWDDSVEEGDLVRISNNHVYALTNEAEMGDNIVQPSPYDGGSVKNDVSGQLAGYVTIENNATVDVAARTVDNESSEYYGLDNISGDVLRDYTDLKGTTLTKAGRTTGVTEADVIATSASVKVKYSENQVYTMRDQIITNDMSSGGDSGSGVFVKETGDLVGQVFGGSPKATVVHKASNVEEEFGVELMSETETDEPEKQYIESLNEVIDITMAKRDLNLVAVAVDNPSSNETVTATVDVEGNYGGTAYLEVQGERYEFDLGEEKNESVDVDVTAPEDYTDSFSVNISGGYVQ